MTDAEISPNNGMGYVFLHRKSLDSRVWQDPHLWYIWCWCLMRASWKERWISVTVGTHKTQLKLLPGQFLFGRLSAAQDLGMKPSSVRNRMAKLKNLGNLDIKEDSHGSIVTIVNWQVYQCLADGGGQAEGQPQDSRRTAVGQPQDTNNKDNHCNQGKKGKKKTPAVSPPGFDEFWAAYPRKVAKIEARRAWAKSKERPALEVILVALEAQKASDAWTKDGGQYIPHPATWLNQGRWDDATEVPMVRLTESWAAARLEPKRNTIEAILKDVLEARDYLRQVGLPSWDTGRARSEKVLTWARREANLLKAVGLESVD